MRKILINILISILLILGLTTVEGIALAGSPPNIPVSLALDKTAYLLNDPIQQHPIESSKAARVIFWQLAPMSL